MRLWPVYKQILGLILKEIILPGKDYLKKIR